MILRILDYYFIHLSYSIINCQTLFSLGMARMFPRILPEETPPFQLKDAE